MWIRIPNLEDKHKPARIADSAKRIGVVMAFSAQRANAASKRPTLGAVLCAEGRQITGTKAKALRDLRELCSLRA
jgi:hypothetical protein